MQLMKDMVSSEVKAAYADPAPGRVNLLENFHFFTEDESRSKGADGNNNSAHAVHLMHACCQLAQLGMHGEELTVGLIRH